MNIFLLLMIMIFGFFGIVGIALRSIFRNKALDQEGYRPTKYYYKLAKVSEAISAAGIVAVLVTLLIYVIMNQ
jgi:hypothetical protein